MSVSLDNCADMLSDVHSIRETILLLCPFASNMRGIGEVNPPEAVPYLRQPDIA